MIAKLFIFNESSYNLHWEKTKVRNKIKSPNFKTQTCKLGAKRSSWHQMQLQNIFLALKYKTGNTLRSFTVYNYMLFCFY